MNKEIKHETSTEATESHEVEATGEVTASEDGTSPIHTEAVIEPVLVTLDELFEANFHYGYKTSFRNPWMSGYVFTGKTVGDIDIIDLTKTVYEFNKALAALERCVSRGGKVLFVGTENHTSRIIEEEAEKCAQYYISKRWLGGLLTNWRNTCDSIYTLKSLDKQIEDGYLLNFRKSEQMRIIKKHDRFKRFLGGIKDIGHLPDMMIITSNREKNAIREGCKLGIPIILLADTNTDPHGIAHKIPGNDRSVKAIEKFITKCTEACLSGLRRELTAGMKPTVEHAGSRNQHSHPHDRPHSHQRPRKVISHPKRAPSE